MINIPTILSQEITSKYQIADNTFSLAKIQNASLDKYDGKPKDEINVEVGDSKTPSAFLPQAKMMRWSNETNFSIRLVDTETGQESVSTVADKIVYEKGNKKIEFYDYTDGEGGFKVVWYLKKKPKTNVVNFTIQSKSLDFFRQPPLTEEYTNGFSEEFQKEIVVTETQVKDLDGNVLVERPENVVGSYAVYHSTKGGMNDTYGKDYKVGKAFHIYRPHIIDASGAETWGILHIENGIYSVEIPQEFLDKAVYPIKSNDTFGYEGTAGTESGFEGCEILQFGSPTGGDGNVDSITVLTRNFNTTARYFKPIMFAKTGNQTGTILSNGIGNPVTITNTTDDWKIATYTNKPSVTNGSNYWVGGIGNSSVVYLHYDSGQPNYTGGYQGGKVYATPSDITSMNYYIYRFSIYATYTPSASGPANLKTYNTNAKANIKTINTNAIANVKTLNTNA